MADYRIWYWFSIGKSSCGGEEQVSARTLDAAIDKVKQLHPNAKLRITGARQRRGDEWPRIKVPEALAATP